jgi:uncharacterized protein
MIIDAFEFARRAEEASGSLGLDELARIDALNRGERLDWRLVGSTDERNRPFLDLEVKGAVELVCQRCLQPVVVAVDVLARFLVATDDAEADAVPLDEDAFDVVVGNREFDVVQLIEDEVILWLPLVPKHDRCPQPPASQTVAPLRSERSSPFAVLGKMKKDPKS